MFVSGDAPGSLRWLPVETLPLFRCRSTAVSQADWRSENPVLKRGKLSGLLPVLEHFQQVIRNCERLA